MKSVNQIEWVNISFEYYLYNTKQANEITNLTKPANPSKAMTEPNSIFNFWFLIHKSTSLKRNKLYYYYYYLSSLKKFICSVFMIILSFIFLICFFLFLCFFWVLFLLNNFKDIVFTSFFLLLNFADISNFPRTSQVLILTLVST